MYLKNRSPNSAREKTLFELWTGTVPSLVHLCIFGCRCYALIPDKKRSKWESHGGKCLFMGYYSANNLFCVFDITSNTFIKKRDVVFHKCVLGHQGFANNRLPIGLDILGTPVVSPSDSFEDVVNITPPDQLVVNYLGIHPNLDYLGVHQSLDPESVNLESVNLTSHSRPSSGYLRPIFAPVPKTLSAALASPDGEKWKNIMIVEINTLERNHT